MADTSKSTAPSRGPSSGTQPDPLIGRTINDRFRIISLMARGGMGKVYKAEQSPLGRICAVKVLNPNYAGDSDPEFHKRFFLEASIASKLSHPNTVTIFDYGRTDDDVYYMAMEFLEGRTLHRLIRDEAPLNPLRVVHIIAQTCRSLREAHSHGVIHRDLKPANIFLIQHDEERDFVKVLDFGLVKNVDDTSENLTQTGLFMGSPKYMAPEQIRGERVNAGTDIYALGVVMYEMLCGKVPFDRGNSVNTLMAHVSDPVPGFHDMAPTVIVPPSIEDVVAHCLQKRPEDRYQSMEEMLAALKRAIGESARPSGEFAAVAMGMSSGEMALRISHPPSDSPPGISLSGPLAIQPSSSGHNSLATMSVAPPIERANTTAPVELPAKPRTGLMPAFAVLALLGIAGGGYAMMRSRVEPQTARAPAVTEAPSPPTNAPVPPANTAATGPTTPASSVHVALDSDPPNAHVFEGTTDLGSTPLQLDWTGAQGDPSVSHTFVFRLASHRDETVTLTGSRLEHTAHLQASAPSRPPAAQGNARARPRPASRPAHQDTPAHSPAGYREIDDW